MMRRSRIGVEGELRVRDAIEQTYSIVHDSLPPLRIRHSETDGDYAVASEFVIDDRTSFR